MLRNALDGLVVVDFTQMAAGPTCTMLLADMGAEVIKVEPPDGDMARSLELFDAFNRNKQGIVLDLKTAEGLAAAKQLVARADVVVESMRPGVMARLGLGYDELSAANPRLIYCSISAYGQTGPYAERPGVDGIIQADSGLMSLIGTPGGEPCKVQAPVVDVFTGYVACVGVLAKLAQRARDGQGGHLDVNLFNSALALQQSALTTYFATGELPEKMGGAAPYSAPNETFRTKDGWVMVAAYSGGRWERLCTDVLGLPELARDERFDTSGKRVAARAVMRELLNRRFTQETTEHWLVLLQQADILCAAVASYQDVDAHPQMAVNRIVAAIGRSTGRAVRSPGFPINSAENNAGEHGLAPALGEHTEAVLSRHGHGDAGLRCAA